MHVYVAMCIYIITYTQYICYGAVAQRVERWTCDQQRINTLLYIG